MKKQVQSLYLTSLLDPSYEEVLFLEDASNTKGHKKDFVPIVEKK